MNIIFDLGNVVIDWTPEKILNNLDLPESKKKYYKTSIDLPP